MHIYLQNKTLRLNNLKARAAMNAKISVFFICVEAIIYLLLYNLHVSTFKSTNLSIFKNTAINPKNKDRCSQNALALGMLSKK